MSNLSFETRCAHALSRDDTCSKNAIQFGVTYHAKSDYIYRRYKNDNAEQLETVLRGFYDVEYCKVTSSGMSAINIALMYYKHKGYRIVCSTECYCETLQLVTIIGGEFRNFRDNNFWNGIKKRDVLIVEKITNPFMREFDIKDICSKAHKLGAVVIVDNSLIPACLYNPFKDGADCVVESLAKYGSGHGVVMVGAVYGIDVEIDAHHIGCIPSPFDCWLCQHELVTLSIRVEKQLANAKAFANYIRTKTNHVLHHNLSCFVVAKFGDNELHKRICEACKLFYYGYMIGEAQSFIHTSYQELSNATPSGWVEHIRFSIGIENINDLIADFEQAFEKSKT